MQVELINIAVGDSLEEGIPVYLFGRDREGGEVTITVTYNPSVKVFPVALADKVRSYLNQKHARVLGVDRLDRALSIAGYSTHAMPMARVRVNNAFTYFQLRKALMKGVVRCELNCADNPGSECDKCLRVMRDRSNLGVGRSGASSVYDASGDLVMQFLAETGIPSVGWVSVPSCADALRPADVKRVAQPDGATVPPCFRVASFDIECYSARRTFPQADERRDCVVMIAATLGWTDPARAQDDEADARHLFCIGACEPIPGVEVHQCGDERELLIDWFRFLDEESVDVLLSYNGIGFDMQYICGRLQWCDIEYDELTFRGGCKARRNVAYK